MDSSVNKYYLSLHYVSGRPVLIDRRSIVGLADKKGGGSTLELKVDGAITCVGVVEPLDSYISFLREGKMHPPVKEAWIASFIENRTEKLRRGIAEWEERTQTLVEQLIQERDTKIMQFTDSINSLLEEKRLLIEEQENRGIGKKAFRAAFNAKGIREEKEKLDQINSDIHSNQRSIKRLESLCDIQVNNKTSYKNMKIRDLTHDMSDEELMRMAVACARIAEEGSSI